MKKFLSLSALFVGITFFASAQKEYKLQYSFKKGDTYDWSQSASMKQHIAGNGFEQNVETVIKASALMKITELTSKGAKFEIEYTKLSANISPGNMQMDSEGDTTKNLPNKIMQVMKGKKFNFVLTKDGAIESIENDENLWSGLTTANGFKEDQVAQYKQGLQNSFSKNSIKNSLETAMIKYPENKVKVGLTWNSKNEITAPIPIKTENVWTLESAQDPAAVVVGDGQIATTDTTRVITLPQGFKATTNFKGRRVVKSHVNLATGWPETSKAYAEQKGFMILLAGGQIPEDMKMQVDSSTEAEYSIKKK
ncbi:MAG TPA: DUF6263 family protein [Cyclobacteriaceae bacterium]|jgi:hypothetical protein|nr:DUF6263 family protein [Cyclobacteriaceae bacterium]